MTQTIQLEKHLTHFQTLISNSHSVAEFCQKTVDYLIELLQADSGKIYLKENDSHRLLYQSDDSPLHSMPNTKVGEVVFYDNQVLIPFSFNGQLEGVIIMVTHDKKPVVANHFELTEICILTGLKLHAQILEENILRKMRVINEHVLSYETSETGHITDISTALAHQLGYDEVDLIGQPAQQVFKHVDDSEEDEPQSPSIEYQQLHLKNRDGDPIWMKSSSFPNYNLLGEQEGQVFLQEDITDLKRIQEMSIRDELTCLYNRRFFNQIFPREINNAQRHGLHVAFSLIDIDNFKKYNDTYGHQEGDDVLRQVAATIEKCYKRQGDFVFRLGGEEFGVVCTVTQKEDAETLANLAREAIEGLQIDHTGNHPAKVVTISTGVTTITQGNVLDANELYKMADVALYDAKESGRNQVRIAGQSDDIELF